MDAIQIKKRKRLLFIVGAIGFSLIIFLLIFSNVFLVPILRNKLHTLIIKGSDSLYTYTLGDIRANIIGGNVEVKNLQISVDSNRYELLRKKGTLPSLTMQLSLQKGKLQGIKLLPLLTGKKIKITEIITSDANIRISRHTAPKGETDHPLWKAIQPDINSISIGKIRFTNTKLLYRNADTAKSLKLQFDECDAVFENVRIDSTAGKDSTRTGFSKDIFFRFHDVKYRTQDSMYKLKAEYIRYSTKNKTLEIDSFKMQPTLDRADFYKATQRQESLYKLEFAGVRLTNASIDRFINLDRFEADSLVFQLPKVEVYLDKTAPFTTYESKIGKYPHQQLLHAGSLISIKHVIGEKGTIRYIEKNKSGREGVFRIDNVNFNAQNLSNDSSAIARDSMAIFSINAGIMGGSPFAVSFRFNMKNNRGEFDGTGSVKNLSAAQINELAVPAANVVLNSGAVQLLDFTIRGEDQFCEADVRLHYNNLSLTVRKQDEATGQNITDPFITKLLNRFVLRPDNPGTDGDRTGKAYRLRVSSKSFLGTVWQTLYEGIQDVIIRSGTSG